MIKWVPWHSGKGNRQTTILSFLSMKRELKSILEGNTEPLMCSKQQGDIARFLMSFIIWTWWAVKKAPYHIGTPCTCLNVRKQKNKDSHVVYDTKPEAKSCQLEVNSDHKYSLLLNLFSSQIYFYTFPKILHFFALNHSQHFNHFSPGSIQNERIANRIWAWYHLFLFS